MSSLWGGARPGGVPGHLPARRGSRVCKPHRDAYDEDVWRWLPSADFRRQMPAHPVRGEATNAEQNNGGASSTPAEARTSSSSVIWFDLLVFLPQHMPGLSEIAPGKPRVIANYKRLELNPYLVFKECLAIRAAWNSRVQ
ncbi:hypothetical protein C8T65DRAFT_637980 [Cerioporus squamosus]|nr:hypothetical protein C8T65DRAFT_637980 [Cerioporus squamosus]